MPPDPIDEAATPTLLPGVICEHTCDKLEVAHRQQRRELEEIFAAREAKMKEEQESLRSQVRQYPSTKKLAVVRGVRSSRDYVLLRGVR